MTQAAKCVISKVTKIYIILFGENVTSDNPNDCLYILRMEEFINLFGL